MSSLETSAASDDVRDLSRTFEPDRYLAATLAETRTQGALIALCAFAADLRRIPMVVTEPMLGEIRLQWWRDALATLESGGDPGAPLAVALGRAIATHKLPVPLLVAMTEARAFDLYSDPVPDAAALDGYLAKTEAVPFELALRILGAEGAVSGAIAQLAGRAYGLTRLLHELPRRLADGSVRLPPDMLARHGVTTDVLLSGEATPAVRAFVAGLSRDIETTVATLRPQVTALHPAYRAALLPLAVIPAYLSAVRRRAHPLRDIADLAPLARVWRMSFAHVRGRI